MRYPVGVVVQWLICQNQECNQIVVQVTRTQRRAPQEGSASGVVEVATWLAVPKVKGVPALDKLVVDPMRKGLPRASLTVFRASLR